MGEILFWIVSWAVVTSRPLAPNDSDHGVHQPDTEQRTEFLQVSLRKGELGELKEAARGNLYKGENKMGSIPPRCEDKCYGCMPCEAIQVPTTTTSRIVVQYTNYEPEGWRCQCGHSFYTP